MTRPGDPASADYFQVKLDAADLKASSVRGTFLFGSAQIFRILLQLASQVVLARLLFPDEFGLVAMALPVVGLAGIFSVGFGEAVVQRPQLHQAQVSALFWLNMAVSTLAMLLTMLAAPLAAMAYGEPRITLLIVVLATTLPIGALSGVQYALLARHLRFKMLATTELAAAVVGTVATILAAWLGWSYWSLAAGNIVQAVFTTVVNWSVSDWRPSRPRSAATLRSDVHFGANVTGYNLGNLITTSADNVIIGMVNGERALGLYDRSYRLVVAPIGQAIAPIGRVAVPLFSRLLDDPAEYRRAFLVAVQTIILLTVPGMLVCILEGPEIVQVLLGSRWTDAGVLLPWIAVGGLTSGLYSSAQWLLISQARMRGLRRMTIISAVLNLASFSIGSLWGIEGVAIAAGTVFAFVTSPLVLYGATRHGPVSPGALALACAPFVGSGIVTAAAVKAAESALALAPFGRVALALCIAYAIFAATALASAEQRRRMLAMLRMLKRS